MTLRVWLNRTYGTYYHSVGLLKNNPDGVPVHVIGSHTDAGSPVLMACDETFIEPATQTAAEGVEFALAMCTEYNVDVFWPTRHQEAIAANIKTFEAAGVRVMVSGPEAISLFEDKAATYVAAADLGLPVPVHHIVTTAAEFEAAYNDLADLRTNDEQRICFKPVRGVGAEGFRIVTDGPGIFADLSVKQGDHLSYADTMALMSTREKFLPRIVMPLLPGGEVSVDTLSLDGKVLSATPRFKRPNTRLVTLAEDPTLVEYTTTLIERYNLSYLANVQFRFDDHERPFLLEVNTRASGGLFQSCHAAGNLPWYAVQMALNGIIDVPAPVLPKSLVPLSTVVAIP